MKVYLNTIQENSIDDSSGGQNLDSSNTGSKSNNKSKDAVKTEDATKAGNDQDVSNPKEAQISPQRKDVSMTFSKRVMQIEPTQLD